MADFIMTPPVKWLERRIPEYDPTTVARITYGTGCFCEENAEGFVTYECLWTVGQTAANTRAYSSSIAEAWDDLSAVV